MLPPGASSDQQMVIEGQFPKRTHQAARHRVWSNRVDLSRTLISDRRVGAELARTELRTWADIEAQAHDPCDGDLQNLGIFADLVDIADLGDVSPITWYSAR